MEHAAESDKPARTTRSRTAKAKPERRLARFHLGGTPNPGESYQAYLDRHHCLRRGFSVAELVRGTRRLDAPPPELWPNMVPTLLLAIELRTRMVERHGARGLRVNAAFRRSGGAPRSRHKSNRALDLDLLEGDRHLAAVYYEEAVRLWCEVGEEFEAGLGLYCPHNKLRGIRVHLDTGTNDRTWQITGRAYVRPAAALRIAKRLEITPPTENDQ